MKATTSKICEECKGICLEIFIDKDGEEKIGAGLCQTCRGAGRLEYNYETERWE